jgi:hypothetical protein
MTNLIESLGMEELKKMYCDIVGKMPEVSITTKQDLINLIHCEANKKRFEQMKLSK